MCIALGARVTFSDALMPELYDETGTVVSREDYDAAFAADVAPFVSEEERDFDTFLTDFGSQVIGADVFIRLDNPLVSEGSGARISVVQIMPDMVTVDSGDIPSEQ